MVIKRICSLLIVLACLSRLAVGSAGPLEEYRDARMLYVFAAACRAAYDDRLGRIALDALADNGWEIHKYNKVGDKADARLLLANKDINGQGQIVYLLAATGTETIKDVWTDLMVDRVYFWGKTPEEMVANSEKKAAPFNTPAVHRGFFHYVRTAFAIRDPQDKDSRGLLFDAVVNNPDRKIFLVGHSLGGAAATVGAAALLNFGAKPDQLSVVTFGAPAVGNEAFRSQYGPQLNLTRYVVRGDMVTGVLQGFKGYVQMGQEVSWSTPDDCSYNPHDMVLYLDFAIKNYYHKRQQAIDAGELSAENRLLPTKPGQPFVYVSPVVNNLPGPLAKEFPYMKESLYGEYRELFPAYVFADGASQADSVSSALKAAAAAGCQWLVMPAFQGERLKNAKEAYQIVFQQTVYRVRDGKLISMETYSSGTQNLTPLEAAIHGAIEMSSKNAPWLNDN